MRTFFIFLALLAATPAFAVDVKISQLPVGTAASSTTFDSFPFVSASTNVTKRMTLWDLINLPPIVSTYAPKASPTFTGTVTAPTFSGALSGNASTASALAANPTDCSTDTFATAIAANGNLTCAAITPSGFTGTLPVTKGGTGLASTTANQLLYSSATSTIAGLATANTGVLVTSSSGVPSVQACTTANRVLRTDGSALTCSQVAAATDVSGQVPIANGGTGQATKAAGFDALSPMTTLGDLIYGGASGTGTRLANGSTGQVLTATTSAAPSWAYPAVSVASKTSNYTVVANDGLLKGDATGGAFQFTLPAASAITGKLYRFVKTDSSTNAITIARAGSDTINGATSFTLSVQYESTVLVSDGSATWYIF